MRWVRAAVLVGVLLFSIVASPADGAPSQRSERQEYFLSEPLVPDCWLFFGIMKPYVFPGVPSNKGGACFDLRTVDLTATVKIEDDSGLPVSGTYEVQSPSGSVLTYDVFCESFKIEVPRGAARLTVFVHGPTDGALIRGPSTETCVAEGSVGAGTTGTITARFKMRPADL